MEEFTVILLNATGGAKIGNKTTATLRITRNDDPIYFAGGITILFEFASFLKSIKILFFSNYFKGIFSVKQNCCLLKYDSIICLDDHYLISLAF